MIVHHKMHVHITADALSVCVYVYDYLWAVCVCVCGGGLGLAVIARNAFCKIPIFQKKRNARNCMRKIPTFWC